MIVRVKLLSDLRKYLGGRAEPVVLELPAGSVVGDVARALRIDPAEEMVVGINGQLGGLASALADGDEVMLVPPMSGG